MNKILTFTLEISIVFVLLIPTAYSSSIDENNKSNNLDFDEINKPSLIRHARPNSIFHIKGRDPQKSYWETAPTNSEQERLKGLGELCALNFYCRTAAVVVFKIASNSSKFLGLQMSLVLKAILPPYAGDPNELKKLEFEKINLASEMEMKTAHKNQIEKLNNATNKSKKLKSVTNSEVSTSFPDRDQFLILVPPDIDPEEFEISPRYEMEILKNILPVGLDPVEFELIED